MSSEKIRYTSLNNKYDDSDAEIDNDSFIKPKSNNNNAYMMKQDVKFLSQKKIYIFD